jgi:hypothetical protein
MVNTVFKGDIAEISWGMETGISVDGDGSTTGFGHAPHATLPNTSVITLGATSPYVTGTALELPDNSLVGCILRFSGTTSGGLSVDYYATTRRTYYITANDTTNRTINIQPALIADALANAPATDTFTIDSIKCPTFDINMGDVSSSETHKVKSDQFFGLLNSFSLPEPVVDVRKQHIVGMGRDVNVLTSGKETLSGGSMALNAHTLRWMKYALGGHTAKSQGEFVNVASSNTLTAYGSMLNSKDATAVYAVQEYGASTTDTLSALSGTTATGATGLTGNALLGAKTASGSSTTIVALTDNWIDTHENAYASGGIFKTLSAAGSPLYGSYGALSSLNMTGCADIDTGALARGIAAGVAVYLLADTGEDLAVGATRIKVGATIRAKFAVGEYVQIIDKDTITIPGADATLPTINKHEIRRIIAVAGSYIYIEQPLFFAHLRASCGIERIAYATDDGNGSPHIDATTKALSFGVEHTIFGHTTLPTFMIEQSFRQTDASPGSEQMLRLYNGCKVASGSLEADTEGELKLSLDYEAGRHYTDTNGFFTPHRMFENTANSIVNRKASGICIDGEKPYLFQNMSIEVFGTPVLRGTSFNIGINNTNTARWYIRGYEGGSADGDQVQNGGTQFAMDITEAQREYTFTFSAIIEDDRLWEELRTRRHHKNSNDIVIRLNKPGSGATRQSAVITVEDYTITKADHQIPDDKGAVQVEVELVVRHLKITETSPYFIL